MPVHQRDDEEIHGVTSDARPRAREDDAAASTSDEPEAVATGTAPAVDGPAAPVGEATADHPGEDDAPRERARISLPLVPLLAVLLVLLLAAGGWLWSTRPDPSAVTTADYVEVLQAARSGVVDLTSFDHLTLDDDIAQIRRVATGDLLDESVAQLEGQREQFTQVQAVVNTEVIGAAVTRADDEDGTVLLVIQSTQRSTADARPQIVKYRIQVELQKVDDRWLLSGITGL
ncbi:Mce-associated membrane protein [Blastococcus fimeti]|nr:Mce-associated membrane protein [Blastococcus fimeti]